MCEGGEGGVDLEVEGPAREGEDWGGRSGEGAKGGVKGGEGGVSGEGGMLVGASEGEEEGDEGRACDRRRMI